MRRWPRSGLLPSGQQGGSGVYMPMRTSNLGNDNLHVRC